MTTSSMTRTSSFRLYILFLHDALPISCHRSSVSTPPRRRPRSRPADRRSRIAGTASGSRSEEHTSELQSHSEVVCRLLLEKKKRVPAGVLAQDELGLRQADVFRPHDLV